MELNLPCPRERLLHLSLLPACPTANHSATHVCADLLLDWSLAAKWARLLTTHLAVAKPTHQSSKHDEELANERSGEEWVDAFMSAQAWTSLFPMVSKGKILAPNSVK